MKNSRPSILIVEDQKRAREFLGEILEEEGYSIQYAKNGSKALRCINEFDSHLILLDLDLPDIHGMEVLKKVFKVRPKQQVIIVSGTGNIKKSPSQLPCRRYTTTTYAKASYFDRFHLQNEVQAAILIIALGQRQALNRDHIGRHFNLVQILCDLLQR